MSAELNRQVAELMGWTDIRESDGWDGPEWEIVSHLEGVNPATGRFDHLSNFTVCENAAGLVLDRIAELGLTAIVYTSPCPRRGTIRRCCIMCHPDDIILGGAVDVTADTRPLAISQAFVEAMKRWGDEH